MLSIINALEGKKINESNFNTLNEHYKTMTNFINNKYVFINNNKKPGNKYATPESNRIPFPDPINAQQFSLTKVEPQKIKPQKNLYYQRK